MVADERERDASRSARNFYTVMSAAERRLLPFLCGTISEQMGATGRGKSQTYEHVKALKERLRALLGEEDDEGRVLVLCGLRRLCGSSADLAPDGDADVSSIRGSR
jgi:hypothetical protein